MQVHLNKSTKWLTLLPLLLSCSLSFASPAPPSVEKAARLLKQGKPEAAYQLLSMLESHYSFDPQYNYLFGVAALQTKHYSQARNAFERTLLLQPANAGAYLDLAITEIELSNFDEARRLLREVKHRFNPPPKINRIIDAHLARITAALAPRNKLSGRIFIGTGYTDNVNNGVDKSLVELDLGSGPVLLPVSNNSQSSPDNYYETGAALNYSISQGRWHHQLSSALQHNDYQSMTEFNTTNAFISSLSRYNYERSQLEASAYYSTVWLAGDDYQSSTSIAALHSYQLPSELKLTSQLRLSQVSYTQTPNNNIRRSEATLYISRPVTLQGINSLIQGSIRAGKDIALSNRAGGDQQHWQLGTAVITKLSPKGLARLSLTVGDDTDSTIYNPALLGNKIRSTRKLKVSASYSHSLSKKWSLTARLNLSRHRSNIDLFTTDTNELSLRLSYDLF